MSVDLFYKTDEDATKAIMATYDILQWMNARDWNSSYLVKTFPSDESNVGGGDAGDQPPYQELGIFTYGPSNAPITAVWQSNYFGIYRANLVLNNVLPETDLKETDSCRGKISSGLLLFRDCVNVWQWPANSCRACSKRI
jgi:starch-binding outer membrane protein, SusD/RagB family